MTAVGRGIGRLIDSYADGIIDKAALTADAQSGIQLFGRLSFKLVVDLLSDPDVIDIG